MPVEPSPAAYVVVHDCVSYPSLRTGPPAAVTKRCNALTACSRKGRLSAGGGDSRGAYRRPALRIGRRPARQPQQQQYGHRLARDLAALTTLDLNDDNGNPVLDGAGNQITIATKIYGDGLGTHGAPSPDPSVSAYQGDVCKVHAKIFFVDPDFSQSGDAVRSRLQQHHVRCHARPPRRLL